MTQRVGVITFPESLDDKDAVRAIQLSGSESISLWHADANLRSVYAVVLLGGFSYRDYLQCGTIEKFAPFMEKLVVAASVGLQILRICDGFQILTDSKLLLE